MIINLFAGPGTGKSTTALGLTYLLKLNGYKADYVSEYAKELVYRDCIWDLYNNHLAILGEQYNRIKLTQKEVDYVVADSPILLAAVYKTIYEMGGQIPEEMPKPNGYTNATLEAFNEFNNVNIILQRSPERTYQRSGRIQSKDESESIDILIKSFLDKLNIHIDMTIQFQMDGSHVKELYNFIINHFKQGE